MEFVIIIALRFIQVYSYILLIYAVLSWFPGAYETRLGQLISSLVEPVVKPFRRFRLVFAGLDFTIFVLMGILNWLSGFLLNLLNR
ncbi:YggT family protein [Streptococcus cuniculipharyngis]|uniref:YggT family protein n=1 Tax=Streptococcus cuniculipharyngis TaxID=1562651 RepID=A0A5C5SA23_9STRE|nr:YggT family protein [Streptococcus cuniculipharyngis]TWS96928.1 YggT family protein [Streptococcus cuniculipharyngis]